MHRPEPPLPAASPTPTTTRTSLELANGRLVVLKQRAGCGTASAPPAAVSALVAAEARWLLAARHPNVVRLRHAAPERGLLSTDHAGVLTLRSTPVGMGGAARLLASVAATLAELHGRGLVHGNLRPDHVIVTGTDLSRPVLCSPAPNAPDSVADRCVDVLALADIAEETTRGAPWAPGWQTAITRLRAGDGAIGAAGAERELAALARRSDRRSARLVGAVASELAGQAPRLKEWVERG